MESTIEYLDHNLRGVYPRGGRQIEQVRHQARATRGAPRSTAAAPANNGTEGAMVRDPVQPGRARARALWLVMNVLVEAHHGIFASRSRWRPRSPPRPPPTLAALGAQRRRHTWRTCALCRRIGSGRGGSPGSRATLKDPGLPPPAGHPPSQASCRRIAGAPRLHFPHARLLVTVSATPATRSPELTTA